MSESITYSHPSEYAEVSRFIGDTKIDFYQVSPGVLGFDVETVEDIVPVRVGDTITRDDNGDLTVIPSGI